MYITIAAVGSRGDMQPNNLTLIQVVENCDQIRQEVLFV